MTFWEQMGLAMLGGPWPVDAQNMAEAIDNAGYCSQVSGKPWPEPEQWRDIPQWQGLYQASNAGKVRSLDRIDSSGKKRKGKILRTWRSNGYEYVDLYKNKKRKSCRVHVLVLEAFVTPRPEGMVACHYDGDKTNNSLFNLRWSPPEENEADKRRHGTAVIGEKQYCAKLADEDVRRIRRSNQKGVDLAKEFGVSATTISLVRNRKRWKHVI